MNTSLTFDEKYQAIVRKDSDFEGIFVAAVKTTGIFCRPVCTARKPKPENVEFYNSPEEALINGYRPCKVCKPLEHENETPDYIKELIHELNDNPFLRLKDYDLVKRGLEPNQVRRWFKKHHGITFQAYQRMLRINCAFTKILKGTSVTEVAFESGYESLSGFNDGYISIFGKAPTESKGRTIINIDRFTTPLGPMFACATQRGICLLEFTHRKMLENEFKELTGKLNAVILPGKNRHIDQLKEELAEYYAGSRKYFEVPLHMIGSAFQISVWEALLKIPFGETRSYKQQSIALNNPKGVRAIASANGFNKIAIVVPCHRVIGSDGSLTGYAGGLERKKWLLDHERKHSGKTVQGKIEF
ncbi:MAG: methylated-DNA--[protein]-cysteine S-methyltransferase [Cytophagales bacterium]|nr:methylated-DNA--[protein]-cysteine S-methyltransferase [Cytophagales bacterium]